METNLNLDSPSDKPIGGSCSFPDPVQSNANVPALDQSHFTIQRSELPPAEGRLPRRRNRKLPESFPSSRQALTSFIKSKSAELSHLNGTINCLEHGRYDLLEINDAKPMPLSGDADGARFGLTFALPVVATVFFCAVNKSLVPAIFTAAFSGISNLGYYLYSSYRGREQACKTLIRNVQSQIGSGRGSSINEDSLAQALKIATKLDSVASKQRLTAERKSELLDQTVVALKKEIAPIDNVLKHAKDLRAKLEELSNVEVAQKMKRFLNQGLDRMDQVSSSWDEILAKPQIIERQLVAIDAALQKIEAKNCDLEQIITGIENADARLGYLIGEISANNSKSSKGSSRQGERLSKKEVALLRDKVDELLELYCRVEDYCRANEATPTLLKRLLP